MVRTKLYHIGGRRISLNAETAELALPDVSINPENIGF